MFLLRCFIEFDVFVALFVIVELAIPTLRSRPLLPITRRIGRFLMPGKSKGDLKDYSNKRLIAAKARLEAARTDLIAAETEQTALRMETKINDIRERGDEE
ncbi:hypothetical protein UFOVP276_33 [uncultured Caudovirales phage]|uniref:Uncharacterized protein n=1 Tax=uncultured Caudovirales phage TaxID=2100421 RepID=A0A6J5LDZ9_9CAUD|nr:hypothetical protein UFOVP127_170 [uncultured Caudovirales phage]CAB4134939.1 hypothetical protein UFOVP276_33 [uncultured Caudovirales phage]